jgi:polysaccharide export outer membrane protein
MRSKLSMALCLLFALLSTAAAQTYRLAPGDTISVTVWQDSKLDRDLVVGPDGMISFPLAGQVRAGGRTLPQVEAALRDKLRASYRENLDITVALSSLATSPESQAVFYITGEINSPGPHPLIPPTNILQAIALSGGFSPFAATHRIEIYRRTGNQEAKFLFNYRDFVSGRDLSGNIDLHAGDVVVVPEKGLFGH